MKIRNIIVVTIYLGCAFVFTGYHFVLALSYNNSYDSSSNPGSDAPQTSGHNQTITTTGNSTTISGTGTMTNGSSYNYGVTLHDNNNNNNITNPNNNPRVVTNPATGYFDTVTPATCRVAGWAYDLDASSQSISVRIYRDGVAGRGTLVATCDANQRSVEVNSRLHITGRHGFDCALPASYRGSGNHSLYIHAVDINGTPNNALETNGKQLQCSLLPTCNLRTNNTDIIVGETINLSWTAANTAGSGTITNNKNSVSWDVYPRNAEGVRSIAPTSTTRFTLTVKNDKNETATCERLVTVHPVPPAPDLTIGNFGFTHTCSIDEMTTKDTCTKTQVHFYLKNIGRKNIPANSNVPYRVEYRLPTDTASAPWHVAANRTYNGVLNSGGRSPLVTLPVSPLPVGASSIRVVVNPGKLFGESTTTNNTSLPLTATYQKARVDLSFVDFRTLNECTSGEMVNRICPNTKIAFKIRNDGNKTIPKDIVVPYVIQVKQGDVWTNKIQKLTFKAPVDLKPQTTTADIVETIVNLPAGQTGIRGLVNLKNDLTALSSLYREDVLSNNVSTPIGVTYQYPVAKVTLDLVNGSVNYGASEVVRYNTPANMQYSVKADYKLTCEAKGDFPDTAITTVHYTPSAVMKGLFVSSGLKSTQTFTIECRPDNGQGPEVPPDVVSKTVQVEVVPQVQEI